jgi:hypothetical protein
MKHPFSTSTDRGIAYYYGGNRLSSIADSLVITKQCAATLTSGEHLLYLNTLTSHEEIERAADAISIRNRGKVLTQSLGSWNFCARLAFLSALIAVKKVKVIVLNSYDFSCRTPQQYRTLVHWLREMCDMHQCRIVVYGIHELADQGSMRQLQWVLDHVGMVGEWRVQKSHAQSSLNFAHASTKVSSIVEEFVESLEAEQPIDEAMLVDVPKQYSKVTLDEFAASHSLKINDLRGAHCTVAESELELAEV